MNLTRLSILFTVCALVGCEDYAQSSTTHYASNEPARASGGEQEASDADGDGDDDDEAPPTPEQVAAGAHVRVLETVDPSQRTEVVGLVDVHEPTGRESQGIADLKARAAMRGAEALIHVEVHPPAPGENITHFAGMAIRFNDLLRGRSYESLGRIDIDASMMHEDDAYAELQRRAREIHADLLLNVSFDHGDGTRPLHVCATAIRFRTPS
jgi:uncharacterized protein YbjQ (UPF0145 family)